MTPLPTMRIAARPFGRRAANAVMAVFVGGCLSSGPTVRDDDTPADAAPAVPQVVERGVEITLHRPQAVFLLDQSASMSEPIGEAGQSRLEVLAQGVADTLGEFEEVDLGAVFFDDEVIDTIPVGPDAAGRIRTQLEAAQVRGGTLFGPPLRAAHVLFADAPPADRSVFFATDGMPNISDDGGQVEVERLRAAGVTVFSLYMGDYAEARALVLSFSGTAERPADPRFAAQAVVPQDLGEAFSNFSTWIRDGACRFTLPDDAPAPEAVTLLVVSGAVETPVALVAADALHDQGSAVYAPAAADLPGDDYVLNWAACAPILHAGAELRLRWTLESSAR
jgi:hypothetical protein